MQDNLFGIIAIVICSLFYFLSWKYYKKENFKIALLLIVLSGLILCFFTASDFFLHAWDERYHALVAKNLIQHPLTPTLYDNPILPYDYKSWTGNHIWVHKQPLPLWLMAGSMKIFGINEIALRLPSILMSTIGIVLTYKIGGFFYNKKVGLFAAFLFSINGLIIELTGGRVATDHIDLTFMFFILLAVYLIILFIERKQLVITILIGLCIGAALLTKWLPALIVLPIWLLLVWDSKSFTIRAIIGHFALMLFITVLVALPWQLYIYQAFPLEAAHEASFNLRHFTEVLDEQGGSIFYFINQIRINYGELIYLPLIWFMWGVIKYPKKLKPLALCIWFLIPLIFFSLAKTKMQGYILLTAPALFVISSAFFFELIAYKDSHKPKWLINVFIALFIIIPIRYGLERMKPFDKKERNPKWTLELKTLNERNIKNGVLLNYENPIEAMFYTNLSVYAIIPSNDKIEQLISEGYQILLNDRGDLDESHELNGVEIIRLTSASDSIP